MSVKNDKPVFENLLGQQNETKHTDYLDNQPQPKKYDWTISALVTCLIGGILIFISPLESSQKMNILTSVSIAAAIVLLVHYIGIYKNRKDRDD
ncbi:MAG: hypothetical protein QM632_05320 [Micrococcaceae bacterium]